MRACLPSRDVSTPGAPWSGRRRFTRYLRALASYFRTQPQSMDPSLKAGLLGYLRGEIRSRAVNKLPEQFTTENSALMVLLQSLIS